MIIVKCQKHPFVIYADTECILEPISTCFPNNESNSSTTKTHLHTPSAIGYKIFYEHQPDLYGYKSFHGRYCIEDFLKALVIDCNLIMRNHYDRSIPMQLSQR